MTDRLLDYALDQLTAAERLAVEGYLAEHPEAAAVVARLRLALRPLGADRAGDEPPPGLAADTLAFVANSLVEGGVTPARRRPAPPAEGWRFNRRWVEVGVALSLGFVALGLALGGVGKLRAQHQVVACQEQLRSLHGGLSGYADAHGGRYPEVGTAAVPAAGEFVGELVRAGQYDAARSGFCPAGEPTPERASYAYTLGYRATPFAAVTGLRRADFAHDTADWTPIAADLPSPSASPVRGPNSPHGRGQNVLFVGGMVRFATTPTVGINGDDIYRNDAGVVRAGLRSDDTTLGRPGDIP